MKELIKLWIIRITHDTLLALEVWSAMFFVLYFGLIIIGAIFSCLREDSLIQFYMIWYPTGALLLHALVKYLNRRLEPFFIKHLVQSPGDTK
jgi:hypothetical protein